MACAGRQVRKNRIDQAFSLWKMFREKEDYSNDVNDQNSAFSCVSCVKNVTWTFFNHSGSMVLLKLSQHTTDLIILEGKKNKWFQSKYANPVSSKERINNSLIPKFFLLNCLTKSIQEGR